MKGYLWGRSHGNTSNRSLQEGRLGAGTTVAGWFDSSWIGCNPKLDNYLVSVTPTSTHTPRPNRLAILWTYFFLKVRINKSFKNYCLRYSRRGRGADRSPAEVFWRWFERGWEVDRLTRQYMPNDGAISRIRGIHSSVLKCHTISPWIIECLPFPPAL